MNLKNKVTYDSPLSSLGSWIDFHAKEYAVMAQQGDADKQMVENALNIVRDFIEERNLILFGGLAIDYALRLEGSHIYPDGERPDFDFLSPNNVEDAYALADILHSRGFEEVGAIRALHVQTMRVRTNFIYVADIGYAPQAVFDRLPTLNYRGLRILHPDFQRMDMHLSFCFPFNGAPREDIFHRWQKDAKRFLLFEEKYPLTRATQKTFRSRKVSARLGVRVLGASSQSQVAVHGFVAYGLLRDAYKHLNETFDDVPGISSPEVCVEFPDAYTISVMSPLPVDGIVLASPVPDQVIGPCRERIWRNPFMDVTPISVSADNIKVFSTRGRLLSAIPVKVGSGPSGGFACMVSPHYLLLYFLISSYLAEEEYVGNLYKNFYLYTLEILSSAEKFFLQKIQHAKEKVDFKALYLSSPFVLSTNTIGDENFDSTYFIKLATASSRIGGNDMAMLEKKIQLECGLSFEKILMDLPGSYFPGNTEKWPLTDYRNNVLFQRSGDVMEEIC